MSITREEFHKRLDEVVKLLTSISHRVAMLERDKYLINLERFLTYEQASHVLDVSERSISRLIKDGELTSVKFKNCKAKRIRRDEVYAYRQREIDKEKLKCKK